MHIPVLQSLPAHSVLMPVYLVEGKITVLLLCYVLDNRGQAVYREFTDVKQHLPT